MKFLQANGAKSRDVIRLFESCGGSAVILKNPFTLYFVRHPGKKATPGSFFLFRATLQDRPQQKAFKMRCVRSRLMCGTVSSDGRISGISCRYSAHDPALRAASPNRHVRPFVGHGRSYPRPASAISSSSPRTASSFPSSLSGRSYASSQALPGASDCKA